MFYDKWVIFSREIRAFFRFMYLICVFFIFCFKLFFLFYEYKKIKIVLLRIDEEFNFERSEL